MHRQLERAADVRLIFKLVSLIAGAAEYSKSQSIAEMINVLLSEIDMGAAAKYLIRIFFQSGSRLFSDWI